MSDRLDRWVSAAIRDEIEGRFYARINEQATLSRLVRDPEFMAAPAHHVGLFADHGVGHVRDVANQVITVLATCHGVLIPRRDARRFALMQGYGVLLAYFHDIGMIDFSGFGRTMHPEYAAQAVFDPALDDLIESIWRENSAGLAWRLLTLTEQGQLHQDPKLVLRELLSLSLCHSKSKAPVTLLNDRQALRTSIIQAVTTDLRVLYAEQRRRKQAQPQSQSPPQSDGTGGERLNPQLARFAHLFPDKAYRWLVDSSPVMSDLVDDVIDTLRALRAADALRRRGTLLETSGHYQIFVDQRSGNAMYALRLDQNRLFLLELSDLISAGEANIASSELEPSGDLRISFHRGHFSADGASAYAARCAAHVVLDIQRDVIESFRRAANSPDLKPAAQVAILLEETEDDITFAQKVQDELVRLAPEWHGCVCVTPSLTQVQPAERARYLAAQPIPWGVELRSDLLARLAHTGYPAEHVDSAHAFDNVRLLTLRAGDVLLEAKTPAAFVYIPLGIGLTVVPWGGYRSVSAQPWQMLGAAGVIRGTERSATIAAERDVQVLVIPKSTYLTYWHHSLSLDAFRTAVTDALVATDPAPDVLSQLEKSLLLHAVPLFKTLSQQAIVDLAARAKAVHVASGETIITKGSLGRSLFVVVEGTLRVEDDGLFLRTLGKGAVFGELAAVTPEVRTATVTATEACSLLELSQADLSALIDINGEIARNIIAVLAGYVQDRTADAKALQRRLDELTSASTSSAAPSA